jgi:hypothetical protein
MMILYRTPNDEFGSHDAEYVKELQRAMDLVETLLEVNPHNDEGLLLRSSISSTLSDLGHPDSSQKPMALSHVEKQAEVSSHAPAEALDGDDSDDENLARLGKRLGLNETAKPKRRFKFFCVPIPML